MLRVQVWNDYMGKNLSREKIVDNFFFVGASLFARFFFIRFAGNPCYTGSIENCIQAQGRRAGGVLFVCVRTCKTAGRRSTDVVVVVTA